MLPQYALLIPSGSEFHFWKIGMDSFRRKTSSNWLKENVCYHGLRARQSSVNGDWLSQWERATFDPYTIDTPQLITKKLVTGD